MNNLTVYSPLARRAIDVGRAEHMIYRARDDLDYREGWVGEILKSDSPYLTPQIAERVAVVKKASPIKELRIYHEAPKLLPAPTEEQMDTHPLFVPNALELLPGTLVAALVGIGRFILLMLLLPFGIDPVVVAVLPNGTLYEKTHN